MSQSTYKKLKLYGPFLRMGFKCVKATEPLQGDSLLFTTKFPEIPRTHLKGVSLGATQWFETRDPWMETPTP